MNETRNVAIFTGNRAEYGLLFPIIKAVLAEPSLALQLLVGGDHPVVGTIEEIKTDGIPIASVFDYRQRWTGRPLDALSPAEKMTRVCADTLTAFQDFIDTTGRPEIMIVFGDRYETLAVSLAAFLHQIPIVHIGGGDVTAGGCVDDHFRFAIADMASWHLVVAAENRDRLISRGVSSDRVIATGSAVLDNILSVERVDKQTLCNSVGFDPEKPIILFTQHPIPAEGDQTIVYFKQSIQALAETGYQVIATEPNRDGFGESLEQAIEWAKRSFPQIRWSASLGRRHYISWLAACDVVVGNSSSGLVETPFFYKPSVSIGCRQSGRIRAANVISCDYGVKPIQAAVQKALFDSEWKDSLKNMVNPFGDKPCAPQVVELLCRDASTLLEHKPMYATEQATAMLLTTLTLSKKRFAEASLR